MISQSKCPTSYGLVDLGAAYENNWHRSGCLNFLSFYKSRKMLNMTTYSSVITGIKTIDQLYLLLVPFATIFMQFVNGSNKTFLKKWHRQHVDIANGRQNRP